MISPYVIPGLLVVKDEHLNRLIDGICKRFDLAPNMVRSKSRKLKFHKVRCMIIRYLRDNTKLSLNEIGAFFEGRDHSTIINALNVHKDMYETDEVYRKNYDNMVGAVKYGFEFKQVFPKPKPIQPKITHGEVIKLMQQTLEDEWWVCHERDYLKTVQVIEKHKGDRRYSFIRLGNGSYKIKRV